MYKVLTAVLLLWFMAIITASIIRKWRKTDEKTDRETDEKKSITDDA